MKDIEEALKVLENTPSNSLDYVKAVAEVFALEGLREGFHPDTPFKDYVDSKGERLYDDSEARLRDTIMEICFDICEKEGACIYEVAGRITLRGTPFETMFDLDHEEKYDEFMQRVDLGMQEYVPNRVGDIAAREIISALYN